tara:strand:+ start:9800 stop:10327 length:528 start_codon:yes stop_codon:yes gene_type:complete
LDSFLFGPKEFLTEDILQYDRAGFRGEFSIVDFPRLMQMPIMFKNKLSCLVEYHAGFLHLMGTVETVTKCKNCLEQSSHSINIDKHFKLLVNKKSDLEIEDDTTDFGEDIYLSECYSVLSLLEDEIIFYFTSPVIRHDCRLSNMLRNNYLFKNKSKDPTDLYRPFKNLREKLKKS